MAKKDKNRHSFWKKLRFKYRLTVLNENTLEEIWKLRVSMFNGIMLYFVSFLVLMIVSSAIIILTPLHNYLPGYLDSEIREQAIKSSIQVDSLEQKQKYQEQYLQNIKNVLDGKIDVNNSNVGDTLMLSVDDKSLQSTNKEKKFKKEYEDDEKYNVSTSNNTEVATEGFTFFPPIKGIVSQKFNIASGSYGIKIVPIGEAVVSTLEGSVMYTGYDTSTNGFIIQLQHKNGFVSIYKGVSMLLKKTTDKVRTGEAIGLMSTDKSNADKKVLQFELWYKGNPVNPELYISF